MIWNWQQSDWPRFRFDEEALVPLEGCFLQQGGVLIGSFKHLAHPDKKQITVDLITAEAVTTSEIEGEILDRDSVRSSIQRQFGFPTDSRPVPAAEQGIAEMMVDLYRHFSDPLTKNQLFSWHRLMMAERQDLRAIGAYRDHDEPMQVVSGAIYAPKVHFVAPPSSSVPAEMTGFLEWFARTAPDGSEALPALTRAGIAHLYFVCLHPFEDGNGRIGRAISEKALAQGLGQPSLTALSAEINRKRKAYYQALEAANKGNEITAWLLWFAEMVLAAQASSQAWIEFLIEKAKLFDRLRGRLNARQEKALLRLTREGPDGFKGGLSAGNYVSVTRTSPATARRDLVELVALGALVRTGERKYTRYWLPFDFPSSS